MPQKWYARYWEHYEAVKDNVTDIEVLRKGLEDAVHRQLMSDVPYGVLLSGGLDSSVIAAVTKKFASRRVESNDQENAWYPRLHSFAVGLDGSPDLIAAKKAADHIGTIHPEINFTIQEGLDTVREFIYPLETNYVPNNRRSTPIQP